MKNIFRKGAALLLVLVMLCAGMEALAADPVRNGTCGDSATWTLYDDGLLKIEGTGGISSASWGDKSDVAKVEICKGITGLPGALFQDYPNLVSVSLPATMTEIGLDPHPFIYCSALKTITMASGNPSFCSADGVLFNKDKTAVLICPGGKEGSYTIPSSVTSVGMDAFMDCQHLTAITIPSSVTEISHHAFYRCHSLKEITVPAGVTRLERASFEQCKALSKVILKKGLKEIDNCAFWGCDSLPEITIPDSVTTIGKEAFAECPALKKAVIPDSVKTIEENAFQQPAVIYCSKGSPADRYAQENGLQVSYDGDYTGDPEDPEDPEDPQDPEDPKDPEEPEQPSTTLKVGEERVFQESALIGGRFLDNAFKVRYSNDGIVQTYTMRTGNLIMANATRYFFNIYVTGLAPGTTTITVYDYDLRIVIWQTTVTVVGEDDIPVTGITLNKTKATLTRTAKKAKPTLQLTATVSPDNATDSSVEWSSSNPKVAKVDQNGKVTALKKGKAVITCRAKDGSGAEAKCTVTVKNKLVTGITLNVKKVTLKKGKTYQLKATVKPAAAVNRKLKWTTSNKKIATVDQNGKITAKKKGTCTVTCAATDGSGKKITCKVTVK